MLLPPPKQQNTPPTFSVILVMILEITTTTEWFQASDLYVKVFMSCLSSVSLELPHFYIKMLFSRSN